MGSIDLVELLKKRSGLFYEYAREALSRGHYDMAMFHAEQALQLRLKALALRILGYIPRIHSVRELLGIVAKSLDAVGRGDLAAELKEFAERNRGALRLLEEAYTSTRYSPKTYDEAEASNALGAVEEALKTLDKIERHVFT